MSHKLLAWLSLTLFCCWVGTILAQERRCDNYFPLRRAWFGDLHVHTALSLDAALEGSRVAPLDAYRYARGEAIAVPPYGEQGLVLQRASLDRPIDFAAVTDHAETLGSAYICAEPAMAGYDTWFCRGLRSFPQAFGLLVNYLAARGRWPGYCGEGGERCVAAAAAPWDQLRAAAELANDHSAQCRFTSFVGYEWTGTAFAGLGRVASLHRSIIFANAAVPERPLSALDARTPDELYRRLEQQCILGDSGCDVIAIPHSVNLSLGLLFPQPDDIDPSRRARFEPLVEVVQHKGASECAAGPRGGDDGDALCDFEALPWDSLSGNKIGLFASPPGQGAGSAREVLQRGLEARAEKRVNPYQFGFVGGTDSHRGLAGSTDEAGFIGHGGAANRVVRAGQAGLPDQWEFNPGGLAVLYAEQNTRASLFAAIRRREAYATSGTRVQVRFFGGRALPLDLCGRSDFVDQAYRRGVPMGGELTRRASRLRFAVLAESDAGSAGRPGNALQHVQIVKGWVDDQGRSRQRVYDVAGDPAGELEPPGDCAPAVAGPRQLCTVWQDPEFSSGQAAFYYARVLEAPSCRWTSRICLSDGARECEDRATAPAIQERAWTSPIWYSPPPG